MMFKQILDFFEKIATRILKTPIELIIFSLFSFSVFIFSIVVDNFCSNSFRESIIPYTGWNIDRAYSISWFFSFIIIFSSKKNNRLLMLYFGLIFQLFISIVFGFFDLHRINGENFGNPYLIVSSFRPIWTIIVPAFWILILITPRIRRFCKGTDN